MCSIATKNSGRTAVDDSSFLQIDHSDNGSRGNEGNAQEQLRQLAQKVMSEISELDYPNSEELLGAFVSELFLLSGEQKRREMRRRKQAEGIAAAKAKGVRFGPQRRALPDGFEKLRQAWRNKEISLKMAAELCGIPKSTFHDAAVRVEMAADDLKSSSVVVRKE